MSLTFARGLYRIRKQIILENAKKLCTQFSSDRDVQMERPHIPVLLEEAVQTLNLNRGDMFIDMTFGGGGHSSALLERTPNLKVFALDRDPIAMEYAAKLKKKYKNQITSIFGKFSDLPASLARLGIKKNSIDGVLFDLGFSSMQFNSAERGFSITKDGPLDMRMDNTKNSKHATQLTAADVIACASQNELYNIFKKYGDERNASKLAAELVKLRESFSPIKTTFELWDFVGLVCDGKSVNDRTHHISQSVAKVFQALRIFVNNELNELDYGLKVIHKFLKPGKKAVVITYHALEDRIVKRHFSNEINKSAIFDDLSNEGKFLIEEDQIKFKKDIWESFYKRPLFAAENEIRSNPRSRSAKLRAAIALKEED